MSEDFSDRKDDTLSDLRPPVETETMHVIGQIEGGKSLAKSWAAPAQQQNWPRSMVKTDLVVGAEAMLSLMGGRNDPQG